MANTDHLGLGCMGMNLGNRDRSIRTVHAALDRGITLLNTGEFYGGGESELVLREALRGIPRDSYTISVKFGVLPLPGRGIYGLDVRPFNVKAHLAYSLHRLGLDYVDIFEPARMDEAIPVEELMGALQDLVDEGCVRHIGLTQVTAEDVRRARAVAPIHMLELEYSLVQRGIEDEGLLDAAVEVGSEVLAFGILGHGFLARDSRGSAAAGFRGSAEGAGEDAADTVRRGVAALASDFATTPERLLQAYVHTKHPEMRVLVGTTREEHLLDAIEALRIELGAEDVALLESLVPQGGLPNASMRRIRFRNGRIV